jgi:thiosulfate dehydrogenase
MNAIAGGDGGAAGTNDAIRGGLMYDKWYAVLGVPAPPGDHPLYPAEGPRSGSTTFRCKECHGWDYKGSAGAYGMGSSHYSGIPGIMGTKKTPTQLFDLLKFNQDLPNAVINGHGFGEDYGMTDQDINDLVEFIQVGMIDTDLYIDGNDEFIGGDLMAGEMKYTMAGMCIGCHGPDGTAINFHDPDEPEWVGTIAVDNPWEFLHKVRYGNPGSAMPSWFANHPMDDPEGAVDIGTYCQTLPVTTCPTDVNRDGVTNVDDLLDVILTWGEGPCGG